MLILTIKTDNPTAEIGLHDDQGFVAAEKWQAHRELAETIHLKIKELLERQGQDWPAISGVICFAGPGSFTGLRIGLSVGNALAYGLSIPIVAAQGEDWAAVGTERLKKGDHDPLALPHYGAEVHITTPRQA
jgi:tRNA threonylcarbamoyladenosine biosynthesis protein TsaB